MFRWSSKCIPRAEIRSETTTWVSEKQQTFPIFDLHMTRRALSCRVIPVPGRWAEIDAKIVFNASGCSTVNCSKSANSFRQNGFCVRFFRPWLSFGGAKSQNEFVTKPLSCNKGSVHEVEISNFLSQKSMFRWSSKCIPGAGKRSETTT